MVGGARHSSGCRSHQQQLLPLERGVAVAAAALVTGKLRVCCWGMLWQQLVSRVVVVEEGCQRGRPGGCLYLEGF
jgi:hypothetical protein